MEYLYYNKERLVIICEEVIRDGKIYQNKFNMLPGYFNHTVTIAEWLHVILCLQTVLYKM